MYITLYLYIFIIFTCAYKMLGWKISDVISDSNQMIWSPANKNICIVARN